MIREGLAWTFLGLFGLVLVIGGFEGAIGKLLACLLVPAQIVSNE